MRNPMRSTAIAVSALLLGSGLLSSARAQTAATQGNAGDLVSAADQIPSDVIELAGGIADFAQHLGMAFVHRGPELHELHYKCHRAPPAAIKDGEGSTQPKRRSPQCDFGGS